MPFGSLTGTQQQQNKKNNMSGFDDFMKTEPGGMAINKALGLFGGAFSALGQNKMIKALLPGMQQNLAQLGIYGQENIDMLQNAYGGYGNLVDLNTDPTRNAMQAATNIATDNALMASGGRVEGSQMAFDELAEARAEGAGLTRRSVGDTTDVLQSTALRNVLDNRTLSRMGTDFARQGQVNQMTANQNLQSAFQNQAQVERSLALDEMRAEREKQMLGIQGQLGIADATFGLNMAKLQQQGAINQTEAQRKGSFLRGLGQGLMS